MAPCDDGVDGDDALDEFGVLEKREPPDPVPELELEPLSFAIRCAQAADVGAPVRHIAAGARSLETATLDCKERASALESIMAGASPGRACCQTMQGL